MKAPYPVQLKHQLALMLYDRFKDGAPISKIGCLNAVEALLTEITKSEIRP